MSFEVEAIQNERVNKNGSRSFLVKWVGYTKPTWEPEDNLDSAKDLVNEFLSNRKESEDDEQSENSYDEEETYEVEKIISHRTVKGKTMYRIKWLGYEEFASLEEEQLEGCIDMLNAYKNTMKIGKTPAKGTPANTKKTAASTSSAAKKTKVDSPLRTPTKRGIVRSESPSSEIPSSSRKKSAEKSNVSSPRTSVKKMPTLEELIFPKSPAKGTPARRQISVSDEEEVTSVASKKKKNEDIAKSPATKWWFQACSSGDIEIVDAYYEVDSIKGHTMVNGKTKYLVLWSAGDETWEPEENLEGAEKLIEQYRNSLSDEKKSEKKKEVAATTAHKGKATPKQRAAPGPSGPAIKEIIEINKSGRMLVADVIFDNGDLEKMNLDILQEMDKTLVYKSLKKKLLNML